MPRALTLALLSVVISACGHDRTANPTPADGLALGFSPSIHDGDECRVLRAAQVDQDKHGLYLVRGSTLFTNVLNNSSTRIPLQVQFRGLTGVQRDTITSLPELDAPCASVAISMTIDECVNHDRTAIECPAISLSGQSMFAGISVQRR